MQIYTSFDVQNVKEGGKHAMKSHLQSSLNLMITRCPTLVKSRRGTIQKPLCHTQLAFAILTTTQEHHQKPTVLVGYTGPATKSHCNDPPLLKCTIQTKWRSEIAHMKNACKRLRRGALDLRMIMLGFSFICLD